MRVEEWVERAYRSGLLSLATFKEVKATATTYKEVVGRNGSVMEFIFRALDDTNREIDVRAQLLKNISYLFETAFAVVRNTTIIS